MEILAMAGIMEGKKLKNRYKFTDKLREGMEVEHVEPLRSTRD